MSNKINSLFIGTNKPSNYCEYVEFNGYKFYYHIEFSNGDPCGFNYKQSISIMTKDGKWEYIADSRLLGCVVPNNYHASSSDMIASRDYLIKNFEKFIKAVYA